MPGPAPKEVSVRRGGNRRADTLSTANRVLPRTGRPGDPPAWPFGAKPARAVAEVWAHLWGLPQAVVWEEQGSERVVARYTRVLLAAERPKATAAHLQEVRQLEDRLGLTPMAMLRLRWTVGDVAGDEEGPGAEVLELFADAYMADLYALPDLPPLDEDLELEGPGED